MSIGNLKDQGNKGNNLPYQLRMLQLLAQIDTSINNIPGVDFVTRTTTYQATAPGPGYSISDILVRYDVIDIATNLVASTIWFNQNTQLQIATPTPGTYIPITPPSTVFVGNGAAGAAVNIQDGGNSITVDGSVSVSNLPAIQPVSGTVNVNQAGVWVVGATQTGAWSVGQTGTWNINNITGTISLPTGAATAAKQDTGNTSLSSIDSKLNTLGQKTMAASVPVTLASDQSFIVTSTGGNIISSGNSTTTPLAAGATFTGASEDVTQYGVIQITLRSDVASATDGLMFLFSADNVNFYSSDEYTIGAGKFKTYSIAPAARYFKVSYTNGAAPQGSFLITTQYKQVYTKPSSHRLADNLSSQDDAEVVQSILVAKLPSGEFENIRTTTEGHLISDFAQNQKDAFDRLITVSPVQLNSYDHRVSKRARDFDEVIVGSATSVLNTTTATVDITTTTGATDSVIRQTYVSFVYTRGNSQQGLFSLNLNGVAKTNNVRYFGIGDNENGSFIGVDGTGFFVMRRSKTSGVVVDVKTYQSSFNKDKLDGTGSSGIVLDLTKQNLFGITYSWLGTNAIIYTITIGGIKQIFHIDNVGNNLTTAWCQSGQLPLRFENTNTGITASSTTFNIGCSAISTLGSPTVRSVIQSVSSQVTPITISATEKVCAGIRLRSTLKYVSIEPVDYQILPVSGTTNVYYKIILRPTLVGATWAPYGEISEVLTNTPTYTGGIILQEGYLSLATAVRLAQDISANLESTLGYSIAGVPDALIIVIRTDSGNGSIFFTGSFRENF